MAPHRIPRIVVIGSSNTDLVLTCQRLPRPGETLLGGAFARAAGGKGANQAVAAARAGARVAFVGGRGSDDLGAAACAGLRREGIDTRHFKVIPGVSSGVALILIGGRSRENLIGVAASANDRVTPDAVQAAESLIRRADIVIAQLEVPLETVREAAAIAGRHGVPFLLNPAPARKLPATLLRRVTTLVPNEHEAALLTGVSDPATAARRLRDSGCEQVVVTLGARGALVCDALGTERIPAPKVRPVDTVGAGDCFCGWLAAGIGEGLDLRAAARRAVRAAARAVTRSGAQSAMPMRAEVAETA